MRADIPNVSACSATITLYLDKKPFMQRLGIADEKHIYLLLVARSGEILWRTKGRWSAKKEQELFEFLLTTAS